MEYRFGKFGPFVFQVKLDKVICKEILKLCEKKNNANHKLAGHLKDQYDVDKNKYFEFIKEYLKSYVLEAEAWYDKKIAENSITISSAWVNYMKAGDFNPPHTHMNCNLSSVLFLDLPKGLAKERKEFLGNHAGPGSLEFLYGEERELSNINMNVIPEVGDLIIFPFNVRHTVCPFKCRGTRVSLAANFILK
tara:strand:+ start:5153 stop:5728 length:576 start_codon:yes stop_codon:yes gene_type:complete